MIGSFTSLSFASLIGLSIVLVFKVGEVNRYSVSKLAHEFVKNWKVGPNYDRELNMVDEMLLYVYACVPEDASADPVPQDALEQIKLIRKALKQKAPTLSVRNGRGTAWGWVDIWGSGDCHDFTPHEREVLQDFGLRPGGNFCNISPDIRYSYAVKAQAALA